MIYSEDHFKLIKHILSAAGICFAFMQTGQLAPATMKAVVIESFGGPSVLKYRDYPVPTFTGSQMLIKVKAAGVMPIDVYIRSGSCDILPDLPVILGKEIAGIVEEIGVNIRKFKKGDRVYCGIETGGYAEYAPANESDCFPLSQMLTFSQGASLYLTYFGLYKAIIIRGGATQGSLVLVNGACGSLGAAAVQIAKEVGARVVASVGLAASAKLMQEVGADYTISFREYNYLENSLKVMQKPGFDLILELMATLNLRRDRQFLVDFGKVIVMGHRVPPAFYGKGVYAVSYFKQTEEEKKLAADFLAEHIDMGCIRPIIATEYKLEDAYSAHNQLTYNNTEKGKIVFTIN